MTAGTMTAAAAKDTRPKAANWYELSRGGTPALNTQNGNYLTASSWSEGFQESSGGFSVPSTRRPR
jgi:hypothetical protein